MRNNKPSEPGQIVRFHTPYEDENPNQQYVVLEIHLDCERPRAQIQALNTGLAFPGIDTVRVEDLEVVQVSTADLLGHSVKIMNAKSELVDGVAVKAKDDMVWLSLKKSNAGVHTNVWLGIKDNEGANHEGYLFIN